jgi:integrase/recombinase XerD
MASLVKRVRRGGGYTWYVRHFRLGKEFWLSTGTADKKLAQDVLRRTELEDERFKQGLEAPKRIQHISLEAFVQLYLLDRTGRLAPRTIQTDVMRLKIFTDWMKRSKTLVSSVTIHDVEKFREYRLKQVKPGTVNITLGVLRAAFQWAEEHAYTEKNPFAIKHLKVRLDKKIPRALTPGEIETFFNCEMDSYHRAVFSFVLSTGARRSELARLRWDDVDFSSRTLYFRNTKGRKDRAIPITVELAHLLHSIPKENELVFRYNPSWYTHLFEIYRDKAGIGNHLTLHSLRHTSATELLRSGISIYTVQKLLGHSSLSVTERYLHAIPEDLREAAEVLSGKVKVSG